MKEEAEKKGVNVIVMHPEFYRLYNVEEKETKAETWAEWSGTTVAQKRAHHAERHFSGMFQIDYYFLYKF